MDLYEIWIYVEYGFVWNMDQCGLWICVQYEFVMESVL